MWEQRPEPTEHPINLGKVTSRVVNNLAIGSTYYFSVTAYDTNGVESGPSNEVTKSVYFPHAPFFFIGLVRGSLMEPQGKDAERLLEVLAEVRFSLASSLQAVPAAEKKLSWENVWCKASSGVSGL